MRLGYLVPEFPSQTHVFFWREIRKLRRLGLEVFIGATPEMITSGVNAFLVPQADEDAILQKIVILAQDTRLRDRIEATARRTVQRRFDVSVSARELHDSICGEDPSIER